jgi:UDP-glucuronate 4-epimerase
VSNILVTGAAGFIGFHLAKRLLTMNHAVVGVDSISDYYDVSLKQARTRELAKHPNYVFHQLDLANSQATTQLFDAIKPRLVIHLAAQAGVRYSLTNPQAYIASNIAGFQHVLEGCRTHRVPHLVYASSSSVYGGNSKTPFSEQDPVDHPVSLYAATKRANELQAHTYSHLFGLPTTGLRFFTVYGPWGRPDMALFLFTERILKGVPIDVFNNGQLERDFTYVDDIIESIVRVMEIPPASQDSYDRQHPLPDSSWAPFRVCNIGNSEPIPLDRLIKAIESATGRTAIRRNQPMQPGDVLATHADVTSLERLTGYRPKVSIEEGVRRFVEWYRQYYQVS